MKLTLSHKIFVGLIITYSLLAGLNVFLPQSDVIPTQPLPLPKPVFMVLIAVAILICYGGLGFAGLTLSKKLGYADVWDSGVSIKKLLVEPAAVGIYLGCFFILTDVKLTKYHILGAIPHPPFPTSIVASVSAGIGEEVLFRQFFVTFWVWLISSIILKGQWKEVIFWVVVTGSAIAFTASHFPAVMYLYHLKTISEIPPALILELVLINGTLSYFTAYYLRKYGLVTAVGIHFWADVVWHVIWGAI